MRGYWWKIVSVLLILYSVFMGLFTPLKPGITQVINAKMESNKENHLLIGLYNLPIQKKIDTLILKNDNYTFDCKEFVVNKNTYINAVFSPILGKTASDVERLNLYIKYDSIWMAMPQAVEIIKTKADTGASNSITGNLFSQNPDVAKGFPNRPILNETIRNLFFHVPMWFSMIFLMCISAVFSVIYLNKLNKKTAVNKDQSEANKNNVSSKILNLDFKSASFASAAMIAGILGVTTGPVWAKVTWGTWWPNDPKLNGVAIGMLMYAAYFILRKSITDPYAKARISAVYNIFVFPIFISLIMIMPKLATATLHPGSGGSVGFNQYDLDNTMRLIFYPACIGWILFFVWCAQLLFKLNVIEDKKEMEDFE